MSSLRNISSGRELNLDLFCGIDSTDEIFSKKDFDAGIDS
jgi:hypothetical protein